MANLRTTDAIQQATLDALTGSINTGGAGTIKIYSGIQPADPDSVITGTLLATLTFSATAFGATAITGIATANAITSEVNAPATGVATHARIANGAGTTIFDCDVGEAADVATITLDNKTIAITGTVSITAFTLTMPSGI